MHNNNQIVDYRMQVYPNPGIFYIQTEFKPIKFQTKANPSCNLVEDINNFTLSLMLV